MKDTVYQNKTEKPESMSELFLLLFLFTHRGQHKDLTEQFTNDKKTKYTDLYLFIDLP